MEGLHAPENAMLLPSFRRTVSRILQPGTGEPIRTIGFLIDTEGNSVLARPRCTWLQRGECAQAPAEGDPTEAWQLLER